MVYVVIFILIILISLLIISNYNFLIVKQATSKLISNVDDDFIAFIVNRYFKEMELEFKNYNSLSTYMNDITNNIIVSYILCDSKKSINKTLEYKIYYNRIYKYLDKNFMIIINKIIEDSNISTDTEILNDNTVEQYDMTKDIW